MRFLCSALLLLISFQSSANSALPANRHIAVQGSAELSTAPGRYLQATVKFSSTVDAVFDLTVD